MGTPSNVKLGPGLLYVAAIGTTEPTTGSGALPSAWTAIGYTEEGTAIGVEQTFSDVEVAEELDPVKTVQTGRMTSVKFDMAELTAANLKRALNGGTISAPSMGFVTFEPADLGSETRIMLIWASDDHEELWLFRRVLQVGNIEIPRRKAPAKAKIPVEFKCEIPSNGDPIFKAWFATAVAGS